MQDEKGKKTHPQKLWQKKQYLPDAQSYLPTFGHKWAFCGINVGNYTNTLNVECLGLQDLYRKHSKAAICFLTLKVLQLLHSRKKTTSWCLSCPRSWLVRRSCFFHTSPQVAGWSGWLVDANVPRDICWKVIVSPMYSNVSFAWHKR